MVKDLVEDVFDHLVQAGVDDSTIDIVLAALDGDQALSATFAGEAVPDRPDPTVPRTSPSGAFITQLRVRGFRGIGEETVLNIPAGPGLTVVAGRNGSGKSSLTEALECALTGSTARWERPLGQAEFRSGWRNLHAPEPCEIALTLDQADQGQATIRVAWPKGTHDATAAVRTYQVAGQRREELDLGWEAALQSYRPLISYDDLGKLQTDKPSELHDSIGRALALDALTDAVELLRLQIAPLKAPMKRAGDLRKTLRDELTGVDEPRARESVKLLGKTHPDLEALAGLATGSQTVTGPTQVCEQIAAVVLPSADAIEAAAIDLESATGELTNLGARRAWADELRDQLLIDALSLHAEVGDGPCPVCEDGMLDASWRSRVQEAVEATDLLNQDRSQAEGRAQRAERATRHVITSAPAVLGQTVVHLPAQASVVEAWRRWSAPQNTVTADHLRQSFELLATAVEQWQREAKEVVDAAAEQWAPYALRLANLVTTFTEALALDRQADRLDAAYEAASQTAIYLRRARLQPIVDQTRAIWAQLKQESNVSIQKIELTGKANRRAVDIEAVVDDASGVSALSVMSQGELNSLALALYLPRATSDASPFRFLVLDDPVQAMDPTKVDGLAAVLADLAQTRQVVVFSHDDRFTQAVRRLPTPPTVLRVSRGHGSKVAVTIELQPTERHLSDAHAILREESLDDDVRRRVLPGVLRAAIETAAWERHSSERLAAGARLDVLERKWSEAHRTKQRLALLFGTELDTWLGRDQRRRRALTVCNAGTHRRFDGNLAEAYDDAKAVVHAIETKAK